jgi:hypothetical protein
MQVNSSAPRFGARRADRGVHGVLNEARDASTTGRDGRNLGGTVRWSLVLCAVCCCT